MTAENGEKTAEEAVMRKDVEIIDPTLRIPGRIPLILDPDHVVVMIDAEEAEIDHLGVMKCQERRLQVMKSTEMGKIIIIQSKRNHIGEEDTMVILDLNHPLLSSHHNDSNPLLLLLHV